MSERRMALGEAAEEAIRIRDGLRSEYAREALAAVINACQRAEQAEADRDSLNEQLAIAVTAQQMAETERDRLRAALAEARAWIVDACDLMQGGSDGEPILNRIDANLTRQPEDA